jgi:phospholipid-translocating ATPase
MGLVGAGRQKPSLGGKSGLARTLDRITASIVAFCSWLYQKTIVEFLLRRQDIPVSSDGRRIPLSIQHDTPLIDTRRGQPYISNDIRTARYTPWDFLPKQLLFQFSRVGNFYFLCVGIPQTVRNPLPLPVLIRKARPRVQKF